MKPPPRKERGRFSVRAYSSAREQRVHHLINNFERTEEQRREDMLTLDPFDELTEDEPDEAGLRMRIKDRRARNAPSVHAVADFLDHIKGFYQGPPKDQLFDAQRGCIARLHNLSEQLAAARNREEFDAAMNEIQRRLLGFELISKQLLQSVSKTAAPFLDLIGRRSAPEPVREKKSKKKGKKEKGRPNPKPLAKTPTTAAAGKSCKREIDSSVANTNGVDEEEEEETDDEGGRHHAGSSTSVANGHHHHHSTAVNGDVHMASDSEDDHEGSSREGSPHRMVTDPAEAGSSGIAENHHHHKNDEGEEEEEVEERRTPIRAKLRRSNNSHHGEKADEEKRTNRRQNNSREGNSNTNERPKREAAMAAASRKKERAKRSTARPRQSHAHEASPASDKPGTSKDEETYCFCKRVSFGEMIGCDNEACVIEWFHFECIGLRAKPKGKWYCPECRESDDNPRIPKSR